ncbi:MAG: STT3 domain-containing protein [Desulfurococcaceae archaeon]
MFKAVESAVTKTYTYMYENRRLMKILLLITAISALILGLVIRAVPLWINGFEFFEFDSYIEFWQATYVYEKGPLAWYSLTKDNPDTHIFWYPWGRDFIYTSYPLFPLWIGTSYHIIQRFGLGFKEWSCIQPLIFASLGIIVAYFVAKELSGSRIGGILAMFLLAILPAATERTMVGYIEKEGASVVFLYLFILFYSRLLKTVNTTVKPIELFKYSALSALSLSLVGWLWGGYVFVIGTVVLFIILSPILMRQHFTKRFLLYNILVVVFSFIFIIPSPANASSLGIYPFNIRGLGWIMIGTLILPLLAYYLGVEYRKMGLKKPFLTTGRYMGLLILIVIGGIVLTIYGVLPISGRLAWALGLRFIPTQPLVESIAEHQSPLSSIEHAMAMLRAWGVFLSPLIFTSPLILGIIGVIYMLYKGQPEQIYVAVAFAVSFYSYLNAAYMIAIAAYFGILTVSTLLASMFNYILPRMSERVKTRKAKVLVKATGPSKGTRVLLSVILLLTIFNTAYAAYYDYRISSNFVYTLKAGVSNLPYLSDSWYKAMEIIRSTPEDSVVISWWDYGYGISVEGLRASVADGSTLNNTQIGIIGLIMSSTNTSEVVKLASLFNVKPNRTFIMVIDAFFVGELDDRVIIAPFITGGGMPGAVDIPKSLWMIRIGNSVVEELRSKGINVDYVNTADFIYVYRFTDTLLISPNFSNPDKLPLIYKMMVDGMLYWASTRNKTGEFYWFSGNESYLDQATRNFYESALKISIEKTINPTSISVISDRPLKNDPYLAPYAVIVEPFIDPRTLKPLTINFLGYSGSIYSTIFIYQLTEI